MNAQGVLQHVVFIDPVFNRRDRLVDGLEAILDLFDQAVFRLLVFAMKMDGIHELRLHHLQVGRALAAVVLEDKHLDGFSLVSHRVRTARCLRHNPQHVGQVGFRLSAQLLFEEVERIDESLGGCGQRSRGGRSGLVDHIIDKGLVVVVDRLEADLTFPFDHVFVAVLLVFGQGALCLQAREQGRQKQRDRGQALLAVNNPILSLRLFKQEMAEVIRAAGITAAVGFQVGEKHLCLAGAARTFGWRVPGIGALVRGHYDAVVGQHAANG
ncbi:hypothetical protein D3C77_384720 [compost metagenome]